MQNSDLNSIEKQDLLNRIEELENQLKVSQKEKTEFETKYRTLFDLYRHAPVCILMLGSSGEMLDYNLAFSHFLGFDDRILKTKKLIQLIHPSDQIVFQSYLKEYFGFGNQIECQVRLLTESCNLVWVNIETIIVNQADRSPIYFSVLEDITAQKMAEEKNELGLNEKERIINSIHYLFWSITKDYHLISCNENFKNSAKAFNGADLKPGSYVLDPAIYSEDMILYWQNIYNRAFLGEEVNIEFYEAPDIGRTEKWIQMQITPFIFNGEITSLVCFGRDITEQKLHEIQLMQSAKMASLGEMAGGIAHEINNPLSILIGISSKIEKLLNQDDTPRDVLLYNVSILKETTKRISTVVKGLRAFSRNADNDPLQKVLLHSVISDTLGLCQEKFKANGVNLSVSHFGTFEFQGNATQISQVLLNLLNNSYDAISGLNEKWININAEETSDGKIRLIVTDSGKGIPAKVADKIMQPFFTTKEVGKGTGLGLSISLGIMQSHGGSLFLDKESENTKFVMELPKLIK